MESVTEFKGATLPYQHEESGLSNANCKAMYRQLYL